MDVTNKSIVCALVLCFFIQFGKSMFADDENFISKDDLRMLQDLMMTTTPKSVSESPLSTITPNSRWNTLLPWNNSRKLNESHLITADCFGLGSLASNLRWMLNLSPDSSDTVDVRYFLDTKKQSFRVEIPAGEQFGLEWTDFDPSRKTVVIIHGFLSHGAASWVLEMAHALLEREDVNVIAVDWSAGGNSWKYWRAVANTRRVGLDVTQFLNQLLTATGGSTSNLHLIGHSLGAHICSYVANHLGGVARITGLDPAQPCFRTNDPAMLLDKGDAEFVDVIHTNGQIQSKLGLGLPEPCGHVDFYPNGGMKQPGCFSGKRSWFGKVLPITKAKIENTICSHGRAYVYFIESLTSKNCTFLGQQWNMTYYGAKYVLTRPCSVTNCTLMGLPAINSPARGAFYVSTRDREPFCLANPRNVTLQRNLFAGWDQIHGRVTKSYPISTQNSLLSEVD